MGRDIIKENLSLVQYINLVNQLGNERTNVKVLNPRRRVSGEEKCKWPTANVLGRLAVSELPFESHRRY